MRYPPEFIEKVSEASNIVEIISQYTQLKPSGGGYMGRCPFPDHQEKTPSFSVSEAKQVYHCFGCKKSGNIFRFLQDYNGMSFPEALEYLADRNGIPIPQQSHDQRDEASVSLNRKKQMQAANKITAEFYRETLKRAANDSPIKQYIQKRKLKPETLEEFQIGYSPLEWDSLVQHLQCHQINLPLAEEAKLIRSKKEGHGYFDLFRDRLMFPIHSASGEVLAFGGRIHDQGEPKYLNSPETFVFSKGKVLYGLAQTAKHIRAEDCVVLVEGYMDLVSLYQAGIKNVAATMGTALTAEHAKLIKRMTTNVVTLFDSDEAGQMAAERSLTILLANGLFPRGLILTEAKDPDEFIQKHGVEELQKKISSAPELFSLILKNWMGGYRSEATQKVQLADKVKPVFASIQDQRLKSLYGEDVAAKMGVTTDWLRTALKSSTTSGQGLIRNENNAYGRNNSVGKFNDKTTASQAQGAASSNFSDVLDANEAAKEPQKPIFVLKNAPQAELVLLQLAIKSRANFDWLLSQPEPSSFQQILSQITDLGVRQVLEKSEQVYRQDLNKFDKLISLLIEKIDRPELLFGSSQSMTQSVSQTTEFDAEKEQKFLKDTVTMIQQNFLKAQAKKLAQDIKQNQTGLTGSVDLEKMKELSDLHKNRVQLKK